MKQHLKNPDFYVAIVGAGLAVSGALGALSSLDITVNQLAMAFGAVSFTYAALRHMRRPRAATESPSVEAPAPAEPKPSETDTVVPGDSEEVTPK